jgi:hypothetical protein
MQSTEAPKVKPPASPYALAQRKLIEVFFPKYYPHSVTRNYWSFTKWNLVAAVSGTLTGVLSTQALLRALGMGAEGALPVAATLNWVIKDGFGLLGGVLYTALFSGRFDSEPKRYRFYASVSLQVATLSELLTPLVPSMFLVMASLSNVGKNIAWLALSGTRAQMHQSLCLKDNLGDVTAKAGSQNTAAGLVGTGLGVLVAAAVGDSFSASMMAYVPLSCISLYSIYRSNGAVSTRSLNLQRTELVLYEFLASKGTTVMRPRDVSQREVFVRTYRTVFPVPLVIGSPLDQMFQVDAKTLAAVFEQAPTSPYFIFTHQGQVYLWFSQSATSSDMLKGMLQTSYLRVDEKFDLKAAHQLTLESFPMLHQQLRSNGWNVDDLLLQTSGHVSIEENGTVASKDKK